MAASQIQISDSKFDMESAVHTSQGKTRLVFFAQLVSQLFPGWCTMEFCHIWRLDPLPSSCKILFSGGAMGSGLNYRW